MAHFAELDQNNTVLRVIVVGNSDCGEPELGYPDTEPVGRAFIANTLGLGWAWRQCSYNESFRGCYPGIGWIYDEETGCFTEPEKVTNEQSQDTLGA